MKTKPCDMGALITAILIVLAAVITAPVQADIASQSAHATSGAREVAYRLK
jgi:hypothetical protein